MKTFHHSNISRNEKERQREKGMLSGFYLSRKKSSRGPKREVCKKRNEIISRHVRKTKNWVRETENGAKKSKETGRVISRVDPQWNEVGI